MKFKDFIFSTLILSGISLEPRVEAQNITNFGANVGFGPGVDPGNTWTYNETTSTVSGSNTSGNVLFGTFGPEVDFSGSNQISLTATVNAPGAPDSSFLFTLVGQSGATASAVFSWTNFLTPGTTMTAPLTPIVPGTMQNVNYWQIVSLYNDGSPALPINVTFTNANASAGTAPAPGIGGPILTGFGANAAASGSWTYTPGSSTISGNTGYGDSIGGTSNVTTYAGATQISLTASASVAQGTPFTYVLTDNTGEHAYAAFNWANFNGGVKTVTSQLNTDPFFDPTNVQSWQILSGARAGAVVNATLFGAAAVSSASETVLDDFSVGITTINGSGSANSTVSIAGFNSANRAINTSGTGIADVTLGGGTLSVAGVNDAGVSFFYDDFTMYAPEQSFLKMDFTLATNVDEVIILLYSNNSAFFVGSGVLQIPDILSPQSFYLDLASFGAAPDFLAGLNKIVLNFGSTTPAFEFQMTGMALTSVPEPSSNAMVMFGTFVLLALPGIVRRGRHTA
ncbi:MAG: hypothetical protein D4R65_05660 [Verrucomicrobiaceae bacterium]|nr:MAG: hypothetical protein D4R65_05660 [Verrucomicrobiaceae bacterium]